MRKLDLNHKLLFPYFILWILFHLIAMVFISINGLKIESDTLTLLSDRNEEDLLESPLELAKYILKKDASSLKIVVKADSPSSLRNISKKVRDSLKLIEGISVSDDLNYKENSEHLLKIIAKKRGGLLLNTQQKKIEEPDAVHILSQGIKAKLESAYLPFYSKFLEKDPFLFLPEKLLTLDSKLNESQKRNVAQFEVNIDSTLNEENKLKLLERLENKIELINREETPNKIYWSGFLRFQQSSKKSITSEINTLSIVASGLTTLIIFLSFNSIIPFLLSGLTLFSGLLFGTLLVLSVNKQINLLTIGFGISLMGACVDYSIHYLAEYYFSKTKHEDSFSLLSKSMKPIALGAFTSSIAFFALYLSGFLGLSEISLFSIGGLVGSFLSVVLILPFLLNKIKPKPNRYVPSFAGLLFNFPKKVFNTSKKGFLNCLLLAGLTIYGLFNLQANDDLRLLQTPSQDLINNEQEILKLTQNLPARAYFISKGNSKESAVLVEENLYEKLIALKNQDKTLDFQSHAAYLPSRQKQEKSLHSYQNFVEHNLPQIKRELENIGYEKEILEKINQYAKEPLVKEDLPRSYQNALEKLTFIKDNETYLITPIFNFTSLSALEEISKNLPNSKLIIIKSKIEETFLKFRSKSAFLTAFAYGLIFILLCLLYGYKDGFKLFLPSVGTAIITLAMMGILNIPLNFFSILALIIVLGLCVDYAVFYKEEQSNAAKISVLLSSVTTIITFGILATSSAPILQSFGVVIGIGVFFSQIFSALPYGSKLD